MKQFQTVNRTISIDRPSTYLHPTAFSKIDFCGPFCSRALNLKHNDVVCTRPTDPCNELDKALSYNNYFLRSVHSFDLELGPIVLSV